MNTNELKYVFSKTHNEIWIVISEKEQIYREAIQYILPPGIPFSVKTLSVEIIPYNASKLFKRMYGI